MVEEWSCNKWFFTCVKEDWWSQLGNSARWKVWPRINKLEESEVYRGDHTIFLYSYMVCRWVKCIYTWVEKGQITYRVYTICSGVNNICMQVASWWIMHLDFLEGTDLHSLTSDVNKSYKWSTIDSCVEEILRDIVEVWFSYLYGYWRTRLLLFLVTLENKVVLIFWWYCIGLEGWFFPQDFWW